MKNSKLFANFIASYILGRRGDIDIEVCAILNDTTGEVYHPFRLISILADDVLLLQIFINNITNLDTAVNCCSTHTLF